MKPRHKKFIDALPKHKNKIAPAAIEAGYSTSYANKRGKLLYQTAMREQAKEIVQTLSNEQLSPQETTALMSDIVGLDRETIMSTLRKIALNDKDLSTALKVLVVLAREHGVKLDSEEKTSTTPNLTIVVEENKGLVEPFIEGEIV